MEDQLDETDLGFTVITIVLSDFEKPKVDLGGCGVAYAAHLFRKTAEILEENLETPDIYNNDELIISESFYQFEYDEDDDD